MAQMSSVSRAALSKIERGERNPSLTFALQIAEALGMPLADLTDPKNATQQIIVVRATETKTFMEPKSRAVRETLLVPTPGCEIIRYQIPAHGQLEPFPPHPYGTKEVFIVEQGSLRILLDSTEIELKSGDTAVLPGDQTHQLINNAESIVRTIILIMRPHP